MGILWAQTYGTRLSFLLPVLAAAAAGVILTVRLVGKNRHRAFLAASFLLFVILGMLRFGFAQTPDILGQLENQEVLLTGRVATHPQTYGQQQYFTLSIYNIASENSAYAYREEIEISAPSSMHLQRDDSVTVSAAVQSGAVAVQKISPAEGKGLLSPLYGIRQTLYACLRDTYRKHLDRNFAPLCKALVLGNRAALPGAMVYDFKGAGIYHLLAISGLHISLLAFFLMHVFRKRPGWLVLLILLAILLAFNAMVGLKASLLRASSMMLMIMLARTWGRQYRISDILFATFAFLLLALPSYIADVGFWLSFVSFFAIIFIAPMLKRLLNWPKNYFLDIAVISFSIGMATLPLNAYFFGMYSWAAVPSNLVVMPVFYVLMILLFSISALILVWPPLGALLVLTRPFFAYISGAAHYINKLDFTKMHFENFPVQAVVIYYVLLFFLLLLLYRYLKVRDRHGQK